MLNFLILQTYTGPILVAVNPYQELPYYNSVSIHSLGDFRQFLGGFEECLNEILPGFVSKL